MPRRSSRPPHDRLIRAALRGGDDARAFLRFALPRVVAVTIHQGERADQGPTRMADLYPEGADSPFARFGPDFEMIPVDLARTDDDALRALDAPFIAVALLLMKHVGAPDLSARIIAWAELLARVMEGPSPRRALVQLLTDLAEAARDERAPEAFVEVLPVTETTYETLADRLRHEGRQEGRDEGERLGLLEEARRSLTRALELRFGAVDADAHRRIAAADLPRLRAWFDRAVTASTQDAVFVDA